MNPSSKIIGWILVCLWCVDPEIARAQPREVPGPLQPWKDWATWEVKHRNCPLPYSGGEKHLCFWPSNLSLSADAKHGSWTTAVTVFEKTWVPLAGSSEAWPVNVTDNGKPVPVVERNGVPSVRLSAGLHELSGEFPWDAMPQRIAIPKEVGILTLVVDGKPVALPNWDPDGFVWLKRLRVEATAQDLLTTQVYRVIEDGIPMWLHTEIELTVSGKSREEQLGGILPEGWKLSFVESPLPTAVDENGRMKVQVRAGKWTIQVDAFRATNDGVFQFAAGVTPVATSELIGFQANPEFRTAEMDGIPAVDVVQTTFPAKWRQLPVYGWKTDQKFQLVERMRGMGLQRPDGLQISREFWLDADGRGFTYRDHLQGRMQQIYRLDVGDRLKLGAVRVDGEVQLITANPQTGAHGVELRKRDLQLAAIGRVARHGELSATGWQIDADSLRVVLTLPPGWRVFALFGADHVDGDWLTAWTLLDLFLLLIFALAARRLWGLPAGIVALVAFGLAYHEPGAPRYSWFFLLIPVALLRVVPEGSTKRWITFWKLLAAAILVLNLVPFVARQVQSVIYPQLELATYGPRSSFWWLGHVYESATSVTEYAREDSVEGLAIHSPEAASPQRSNLQYDPAARIQTGPAAPEWSWNQVVCTWNGPVSAQHSIRPILISSSLNRFVTVVRLCFLMLLAAFFFGTPKFRIPFGRRRVGAVLALTAFLSPSVLFAQIPDKDMLETLRQRLLEPSDAFPHAGEIPSVALQLKEGRLRMEVEVHAAREVAIPLPGRLPDWSPLSVKLDDVTDTLVCRSEGYLWVTVPEGVHKVVVEGLLPDVSEWQWTFLLKPRYIAIDAPVWSISGLRPNGMPEPQVFFTRIQQAAVGEAAYDQKNYHAIVAVERNLEIGLVWNVHNTIRRLSASGKAVSLKVPLLKGESVLTPNVVVEDGSVEVRLGARESSFQWDSELPIGGEIILAAAQSDQWVEVWRLVTSPVWNVALPKLAPVFESQNQELIPTWHPWPGEDLTLAFHKPEAVSGETVTAHRVRHETSIGSRQRTSSLNLHLESSLGTNFIVELNPAAEITLLKLDGRLIPVRREEGRLKVPLHPGKQTVEVAWKTSDPMQTVVRMEPIKLPIEGSNVTCVMQVPENRWVLWADGPLWGPAVRFWTILVCSILAALALGSHSSSPLHRLEWVLLAIGLTQVHISSAMLVVGWLFLLVWRGKLDPDRMRPWKFNLIQTGIVLLTFVVLGIFLVVVGAGLLGNPKMFIVGNGSSQTLLNWYEPRVIANLPEPYIVSVSVWFYRLLMLFWALWLATALLRWLKWGWNQFVYGGGWRRWRKILTTPPLPIEGGS